MEEQTQHFFLKWNTDDVAMGGVNVHHEGYICTWQTLSYFLCNASLSFFVYITFSTRFRKTMLHRAHQMLHRLCPAIFSEVSDHNSRVLSRPKLSHPLPNSSVTHSQMVTMTSKNEQSVPRMPTANERWRKGDTKRILVVQTVGDANGGNAKGGLETAVLTNNTTKTASTTKEQQQQQQGNGKEGQDRGQGQQQSGQSSKKSSTQSNKQQQMTSELMPLAKIANCSLAKRLHQQKLTSGEGKTTPADNGFSQANETEAANSPNAIPFSPLDGHRQNGPLSLVNADKIAQDNGQIEGTGSNGSHKGTEIAKRSSLSSTLNSQCDAFL